MDMETLKPAHASFWDEGSILDGSIPGFEVKDAASTLPFGLGEADGPAFVGVGGFWSGRSAPMWVTRNRCVHDDAYKRTR